MSRVVNLINKVLNKLNFHFSADGKELRRISGIQRYKNGDTKILGYKFEFVDSASFVVQYLEIYKRRIYNFKTDNEKPFIIDCGANVGVGTLYFKTLYPNAEVVAFEPDKQIFRALKQNIENSGCKDILLINKGVWNTEGTIQFIHEGADGGNILDSQSIVSDHQKLIEIETTSLRKYLDRKVDFLKIDIEGAEATVFEDCDSLLKNVQQIFIEFHSAVNKPQELHSILNILAKNGFRYYVESAGLINNEPFIKRDTINNYDNLLNICAYK
jgi:FkbM family methyltransferase